MHYLLTWITLYTLYYIRSHHITLRYIYITVHYIALHYITSHYITLHTLHTLHTFPTLHTLHTWPASHTLHIIRCITLNYIPSKHTLIHQYINGSIHFYIHTYNAHANATTIWMIYPTAMWFLFFSARKKHGKLLNSSCFFWSLNGKHGRPRPAVSDKELQDMLGALDAAP